ncbi:MAG: hypothetical protein IJ689_07925 [Alphaproteobacteria bacterium]|nr:hypothetical protein [Alphaproteobacteria bacterium]MBR1649503.1 hypothetical protein [Alphaproteobacteria bacterium]
MRIKKFIASDMTVLLSRVKADLGNDAVIISSSTLNDGRIELVAAVDTQEISWDENEKDVFFENRYNDSFLKRCFEYHRLSDDIKLKFIARAREIAATAKTADDTEILAQVLSSFIKYGNFFDMERPVKMFVGPHGCGKTSALLKTAATAIMRKIPVHIISIDNVRAGANNQLQSLADIMGAEFEFVQDEKTLIDKVWGLKSDGKMVLIDTFAVNPFSDSRLPSFTDCISADKVLVLDALYDAEEAVEITLAFSKIGIDWIMPAKLDLTHRLGGIVCALALGLNADYAGVGASIIGGLAKIENISLARLITEQNDE